MPYFAYGSNLNAQDLADWCRTNTQPYPLGHCFGRAWLPDHQLVFEGYSAARGGAVANVIHRKGYAVPGAMFRVMKYCWRVINRKEGAPYQYKKVETVALVETESGSTMPMACHTYSMTQSDDSHLPSAEYLTAIAEGYRAHGLPMDYFLHALKGLESPLPVFVYGTLKRGGRLHGNMEGFNFLGEANISGRLLNCGSFPGFVESEGDECVRGEIFQIQPEAGTALQIEALDRIEGFSGFGARRNLYERRIVLTTDGSGNDIPCWAYRWMGKDGLPEVTGGVWPV